jgi:hypothetical protein
MCAVSQKANLKHICRPISKERKGLGAGLYHSTLFCSSKENETKKNKRYVTESMDSLCTVKHAFIGFQYRNHKLSSSRKENI